MAKNKMADVQITEITCENKEKILDQFMELFTSGNVVDFVYGYSKDGDDICIDIETGDVEVTHPDGSVEKILGSDPKAQAYRDRF